MIDYREMDRADLPNNVHMWPERSEFWLSYILGSHVDEPSLSAATISRGTLIFNARAIVRMVSAAWAGMLTRAS